MKFIENLRVAPEETKKSFAVVVSVFVTFIIVGFSLAVSNPLSVKAEKDVAKTAEDKLPSPFSALTSQIGASFSGLKNDLLPLKEMLSAVQKEMATTTATLATSTAKTASSTVPVIATATAKIVNVEPLAIKALPTKPVPIVKKKVETVKYGPFLIPGVNVTNENMGATAILTIAPIPNVVKEEKSIVPDVVVAPISTTTVQENTPQADTPEYASPNHPEWPKTYKSGVVN